MEVEMTVFAVISISIPLLIGLMREKYPSSKALRTIPSALESMFLLSTSSLYLIKKAVFSHTLLQLKTGVVPEIFMGPIFVCSHVQMTVVDKGEFMSAMPINLLFMFVGGV
jgi:hypothetical protein